MENDDWVPSRDVRNYADGQLTVTITLAEYRYLIGRVALASAGQPERRGEGDERGR